MWMFADEVPQLPRFAHFSTFLDLGRSKGVITVLGVQDIAQLPRFHSCRLRKLV